MCTGFATSRETLFKSMSTDAAGTYLRVLVRRSTEHDDKLGMLDEYAPRSMIGMKSATITNDVRNDDVRGGVAVV